MHQEANQAADFMADLVMEHQNRELKAWPKLEMTIRADMLGRAGST